MTAQVGMFLESLTIAAEEVREVLFEERKEDLLRAGLQEKRSGAEERSSVQGGSLADRVQALFAVVDERHHGMGQHSHSDAGFGELLHCGKTQSGSGSARL